MKDWETRFPYAEAQQLLQNCFVQLYRNLPQAAKQKQQVHQHGAQVCMHFGALIHSALLEPG